MKTLQIVSRHASLTAAVKASGIDLSYNESLALSDLASLDKGYSRPGLTLAPVTEAFVVIEDGKTAVFYVMNCDLELLNKYTPFHGTLHDGKFSFAAVQADEIVITDGVTSDRKAVRKILNTVKETGRLLACKL